MHEAGKGWLVIGIGAALLAMLVALGATCRTCGTTGGSVGGASAADMDVDLEGVLDEYKDYVKSGSQDLNGFERAVNEKNLYTGDEYVKVTMWKDGSVIGFVNKDQDPSYDSSADKMVFKIEADHHEKRLIATDRYRRHYGMGIGGLAGFYLLTRMFDGHRGYYGGWHRYGYSSYHSPGYYRRRSSSSHRWGSSSSKRYGSGSGGWGSGK